jgi:CRISPR-associated protein Cmr6
LPYIPGSAVKGCARRMAIQQLLEAETIPAKTDLLAHIALVFGWGEQDWSSAKKDGHFKSDFAYAVGAELWSEVAIAVPRRLPDASHFAGVVSFLPAHPVDASGAELPVRLPALGTLELDVLTCHHPDYYSQKKNRAGDLVMPAALDNEDPNPVIFPAVAAGHVFAFALLPLRTCSKELRTRARQWLADGLSNFGLGSKTAAGYGWFDCSDGVQNAVSRAMAQREKQAAEQRQKEADDAALKAKAEADRILREQQKAAMASLTPDQQEDYRIAQLTDEQFRSAIDNFAKKSGDEQKAIIRALRIDAGVPGSRRTFWEELKTKAQKKGGKLAQTEQSIRQLSKQIYPGREGKMP